MITQRDVSSCRTNEVASALTIGVACGHWPSALFHRRKAQSRSGKNFCQAVALT